MSVLNEGRLKGVDSSGRDLDEEDFERLEEVRGSRSSGESESRRFSGFKLTELADTG